MSFYREVKVEKNTKKMKMVETGSSIWKSRSKGPEVNPSIPVNFSVVRNGYQEIYTNSMRFLCVCVFFEATQTKSCLFCLIQLFFRITTKGN